MRLPDRFVKPLPLSNRDWAILAGKVKTRRGIPLAPTPKAKK